MIAGVWGKKLGMTQLFDGDKVVPVTAIDASSWLVVGKKNSERDGYHAICVGLLRKRYQSAAFSREWLKKLKTYFMHVREIKTDAQQAQEASIGSPFAAQEILTKDTVIDVVGITRGRGFAGVVKRHGFTGGRGSHGSAMGERRPGAIGWMRRQGRIIKGKRMAGHMGVEQRMMKGLRVMDIADKQQVVFVKGSVPGHAGSLVFMRKK